MKRLLLILSIIGLVILSGCAKENMEGSLCNKPYFEFMKGQCCLDADDNKICDKDETVKEENKENIEIASQPVQALTSEGCSGTLYYFDCIWSYITKNEIQIKLRGEKESIIVIKKIDVPNVPCGKEFGTSIKDGIKYGEEKQFNIPCDFKKNSVESNLDFYVTIYPREGFKNGNFSEEWTGYPVPSKDLKLKGGISGMVR